MSTFCSIGKHEGHFEKSDLHCRGIAFKVAVMRDGDLVSASSPSRSREMVTLISRHHHLARSRWPSHEHEITISRKRCLHLANTMSLSHGRTMNNE
jgi:hypothetical protein